MAESHKLTVFSLFLLHDLDNVLRADAMAVLHVHARFIGHDHALLQLCLRYLLLVLPSQTVRSLMDVQYISDPMACPVLVVESALPQRRARYDIKISPRTAVQKSRIRQPEHRTCNLREVELHLIGDGTERDRPRHIRRAALILTARVNQVKPLRIDTAEMLLGRTVVRHRRVGLVSADRGERQIQKSRDLSPHAVKLRRHTQLIHRCLPRIFLHPEEEFCQRGTVPDVTLPDMFQFHRIFNRLHQLCRILLVYKLRAVLHQLVEHIADIRARTPHLSVDLTAFEIRCGVIVLLTCHTVFRQISPRLLRQRRRLDKQHRLVPRNKCIGQRHRVTLHIIRADIAEPHDIIKLREQQMCSAFLRHLFPHLAKLFGHSHTAAFLGNHPYPAHRHRRSVLPELHRDVPVIGKRHIFSAKSLLELLAEKGVHHPAVKADRLPFLHILFEILFDGRNIFLMHPVQDDPGAFQLTLRLHKIPAVRPQTRLLAAHHQRSCRSGKSRQKFPHLEIVTDVFRIVIVCRRHDVIINPRLPQQRLQRCDPLFLYSSHVHILQISIPLCLFSLQQAHRG